MKRLVSSSFNLTSLFQSPNDSDDEKVRNEIRLEEGIVTSDLTLRQAYYLFCCRLRWSTKEKLISRITG